MSWINIFIRLNVEFFKNFLNVVFFRKVEPFFMKMDETTGITSIKQADLVRALSTQRRLLSIKMVV